MVSGFLIRLCLGVEIQTLKMAGVWSIKTLDFLRIGRYFNIHKGIFRVDLRDMIKEEFLRSYRPNSMFSNINFYPGNRDYWIDFYFRNNSAREFEYTHPHSSYAEHVCVHEWYKLRTAAVHQGTGLVNVSPV